MHVVEVIDTPERWVRFRSEALQQGFTAVPNYVLEDPDLSNQAKLCWCMLAKFAWERDDSFPGQDLLAALSRVDERTVRTWVTELRCTAYVEVKHRGQGRTNVYLLTVPNERQEQHKGQTD